MNFKNLAKTDQRIIGTAVVLLVLSSLLLWQDNWIHNIVQKNNDDLEEIGRITKSKNDVRRRYEVALSWLPVFEKNNIYQGDSIFTGDSSTATIETKKGEKILIAPNSLVVINQKKDSISLDIGFGSVEGKVANGKKLLITSNNNITELVGDDATIKIDAGEGNKLVLNVLSGQVKINTPTGQKILTQDEGTEINTDGSAQNLLTPGIRLVHPLANQLIKPEDNMPTIFKWEVNKKSNRMKIKIAESINFENPIIDARVNNNFYSAYNLPRDTELYWQVLSEKGDSAISKFAIIGNRSPIPIYPKTGSQFFYDPNMPIPLAGVEISLSWEQGSIATHYEVELATDLIFKNIVRKTKTKNKNLPLGIFASGEYYWRIRSIDFPNLKWSEPSTFRVGPEPTQILAPPVPLLSENIFLIPTAAHNQPAKYMQQLSKKNSQKFISKYPRLSWSTVSGADYYQIEIAKNKTFTDFVGKQKTANTYYTWKNIEPGTFYWRVKASGDKFKGGRYTSTQQLVIGTEPPTSLSQTLIVDQVPDPMLLAAQPPPINLKWNPTVFAQNYELEFSATQNFTKSTKIFTENSARQVQIPTPGIFYWRVRALDKYKVPLSPFSAAYVMEFQRVYKDPALMMDLAAIYPRQQDSIILVGEKNTELKFIWTKPYKNATYRIEIASDPSFQVVLFSDITKNNFYDYKDKFTTRIVYWRVRAETTEFVGDWTGANRFLVSYEYTPFSFENSDLMFAARLRAKERQELIVSAQQKRLARIRTPAGLLDLQLDRPQLIEPAQEFTIESNLNPTLTALDLKNQSFEKFFEQIRSTPIFKWDKVPAAERYVIQIARDPHFQNVIVKAPAWNPFFDWDTVRPGVFYYRVQAFNDRYSRSSFSEVHKIKIQVSAPTPTSSDVYVEYFDEPQELWLPPNNINLAWQPVTFARFYEVAVAESADFKDAKIFKSSLPKAEIRVTKVGMYYWRVRAINERGIAVSPFSNVRSLEVIQTNRSPASASGITALFPKNRTMLFVGNGTMNLSFNWLSPQPESKAQIEVSNSVDFNNIIARATGRNGKALIINDLPEGSIYWRVKQGTNYSAISEFVLRREKSPYVPELILPAAK